MKTIKLQELPIGKFNPVWFWLYDNDIGNMKKQVDDTGGYVNEVVLTDEEATLLLMKFG